MEGFLFHFPDFDDPALNATGMGFPRPAEFYAEFNRRFPGEWSTVSWEYYAILDMWSKAVERVQTVEPMVVLSAMKLGGISGNVFGEARWWGRELFGIDHALVGSWPVVRISDGRARIVELRSVLNWCEKHGDLLLAHMRACGQMWYQRFERQASGTTRLEDQAPRVRS